MRTAEQSDSRYDAAFYDSQEQGSYLAAQGVLRHVFDRFQPTSVLDVGCGVGAWLRAAENLGATRLIGIDGPWVHRARVPTSVHFVSHELERTLPIDERVDLAMSLEVAEHLSTERAAGLVADLCRLSDVVLFGAAIPGQGGTHHINEQWQSYWAHLFAAQGYTCFDFVRQKIWRDRHVASWYRQNTLLYVAPAALAKLEGIAPANLETLDVVHPELFRLRCPTALEPAVDLWLRMEGALDRLPSPLAGWVKKHIGSSSSGL